MKTLSLPTKYQTSIIMTKILIAIFLGGGTGSVLRYCAQMALHERIVPYSFPWATFAVKHHRKFPDRIVLCLVRALQLIHGSKNAADYRLVRRLHHLFHILQRRIDADKTRILRVIRPIYLIKYFIGIFCGIGWKYFRKDLLKWQP